MAQQDSGLRLLGLIGGALGVWFCSYIVGLLGLRNTANNVTGVFEYTLEPHDGGTTVRFTCDIKPHGLMWLALPFLIRGNRMRYRDQLSNLRRAIEDGWPA